MREILKSEFNFKTFDLFLIQFFDLNLIDSLSIYHDFNYSPSRKFPCSSARNSLLFGNGKAANEQFLTSHDHFTTTLNANIALLAKGLPKLR